MDSSSIVQGCCTVLVSRMICEKVEWAHLGHVIRIALWNRFSNWGSEYASVGLTSVEVWSIEHSITKLSSHGASNRVESIDTFFRVHAQASREL